MSSQGLFVGIDVSNATLDVTFLDANVRPVRAAGTFRNEPEGWAALRTAIMSAAKLLTEPARIVCGMESTSNMHKRLEQALRAEERHPIEVHVLNPRTVKHFARALLKDCKTDRLDSRLIAEFLVRMQPTETPELPQLFEEFREATRTRRRIIEERTDAKNRLHKLLRYHFPGYRSVVGKYLSKGLLTVLAKMATPHVLLAMPVDELANISYAGGRRVGIRLAEKLHKLAGQAPRLMVPEVSRMLIETTARRVLELEDQIVQLDKAIERMLDQLYPDQLLTSIPGIGKVSAATILAEVGDVSRFPDKTRFVGYCGLYPVVWESGEGKKRYRMTSKGNRMLKMTLLVASAAARQFNPAISIYYERLRKRDKSKKAAGGALARKLAEIVFAVLVSGEPWSAEKASRGIEKGEAMLTKVG